MSAKSYRKIRRVIDKVSSQFPHIQFFCDTTNEEARDCKVTLSSVIYWIPIPLPLLFNICKPNHFSIYSCATSGRPAGRRGRASSTSSRAAVPSLSTLSPSPSSPASRTPLSPWGTPARPGTRTDGWMALRLISLKVCTYREKVVLQMTHLCFALPSFQLER